MTPEQSDPPGTPVSPSPFVTSLAQWVWLLEFDSALAALDASALPSADLAAALLPHFAEVHVVRPDTVSLEAAAESARRGGWEPTTATVARLDELPLHDRSLDCIAVHDLFVRHPRPGAELAADLVRLGRLLRPGGWLSLCSPHRQSLPWRRSVTAGLRRAGVESLLYRAGFREIRCLLTEPSLGRPLALVPDAGPAVALFDTRDARSRTKQLVRQALARSPLRADLLSSYFLFARA